MSAALATFAAKGAGAPSAPLSVHFNPASLKLTISNTIQDDQPGTQALQSVRKSATELDLELLFDTTETGCDVRGDTGTLKQMGRPAGTAHPSLPMVTFAWGVFSFTGVIDSLQETIDFFSADGVPLRSTIQLSMQSLELDAMRTATPPTDQAAVAAPPAAGQGATGTATQAGNPAAGRALAAANGLDSMRFTAGAGLAVGGSVSLMGPVGFAAGAGIGISGGAGVGISGGAGIGISGNAGVGISGGAGIGISGGAGVGISGGAGLSTGFSAAASGGISFGGSASAGISASGGAFAGLGLSKSSSGSFYLDVERLRPAVGTFSISADAGANFDATGRAIGSASAGLRADIGGGLSASASASAGIG